MNQQVIKINGRNYHFTSRSLLDEWRLGFFFDDAGRAVSILKDSPQGVLLTAATTFNKGDKVIVNNGYHTERRYFSHVENGRYWCFIGGKDEWASKGQVTSWRSCEAALTESDSFLIKDDPAWLRDNGVWITANGRHYDISLMGNEYLYSSMVFLKNFKDFLTRDHKLAVQAKIGELWDTLYSKGVTM